MVHRGRLTLRPPSGDSFHPRRPNANARCCSERLEFMAFQGIHVVCHGVDLRRIGD
jgi:hypothetical protein